MIFEIQHCVVFSFKSFAKEKGLNLTKFWKMQILPKRENDCHARLCSGSRASLLHDTK